MVLLLACTLESMPPPADEVEAPPVAEPEAPEEPEAVEAPEPETDEALAIPVEEEPAPELPGAFAELDEGAVSDLEPLINELSGVEVGQTGRLTLNLVVAGVPCKAGPVTLTEEGFNCTLSLPATLGGYALSRGAEPGFHHDGSLARLTFGDLVPPTENRLIEGVPCLSRARLHPNGRVEACTLSRQQAIGGVPLPKKADVELREDGSLLTVISYEAVTVAGKSYEAGLLTFTPEGAVETHAPGVFGD